MPKKSYPEEVEIYGFIADEIAPYTPKGAKVTIGSRTYSVATISTPTGPERKITVEGPELKPRRQFISWSMFRWKVLWGETKAYRGHVADPKEFLIFAQHLPEIAKGLGVRKAELYRRHPTLEKYLEGVWRPKLPSTEEVKMPKKVSEMEKIGIIADTLADLAKEGAVVEIGRRAYGVETVRGPAGGERMILLVGPYSEVSPRAISASVLRAYRYYGHTKMYPFQLADSQEFKIFYQNLPEILRGLGVTKEELVRHLQFKRGRFGAQLLK